VTEQTKEQKLLAEMNLDESHQKFIRNMEHLMGRPLTRQEIMAILQAEQIGHL